MSITITLDPQLNISAETLADAWNADTDARAISPAAVEEVAAKSLESFDAADVILTAVMSGTIGLGFGSLQHVINKLLDDLRKDKTKSIDVPANATVNKIENPDGSIRIVITAPPAE